MSRKLYILLIFLMVLLPVSARAQSSDVLIINESVHTLDETAIQNAAQPLLDRGARVALFLISSGDKNDFNQRMQAAGLGTGSAAEADVIAVYVSSDPGYSEIRWGENFDSHLSRRARDIRSKSLNPYLRDGEFSDALVSVLGALENALQQPPITSASEPEETDNSDFWMTLLVIGIIGASIVYFIFNPDKFLSALTSNLNNQNTWSDNSTSYSSSSWSSSDSSSSSDSGGDGGSDGGSWND